MNEIPAPLHTALSSSVGVPYPKNSFCFTEVTYNEVRDVIDAFKNNSSSDIYGLNMRLLKSVKNIIIGPLTKLVNECFRKNTFPSVLKVALVTPVFKKGDPDLLHNYRPISLLPAISKIVEKCMANRIAHFLETNNCLSESQFGFCRGRNTVTGIMNLVSGILDSFHKSEYSAVLFCDLSKAFDCVGHDILLGKLESLEIVQFQY